MAAANLGVGRDALEATPRRWWEKAPRQIGVSGNGSTRPIGEGRRFLRRPSYGSRHCALSTPDSDGGAGEGPVGRRGRTAAMAWTG
jgi:hypothetical protein